MIEKYPAPYIDQLKDSRWINRRMQLRRLSGGRCEDCKAERVATETHHTAYIPALPAWEHPDSILMVLCPSCHERRQLLENALHVVIGKMSRRWSLSQLHDAVWDALKAAQSGSDSISIPCK